MATDDGACCIIEVMGARRGGLPPGRSWRKRGDPARAPHVILLPELPFDARQIPGAGQGVGRGPSGTVSWWSAEGIRDASGREIGADQKHLDAFGHPVLAGAGEALKDLVQDRLKVKARTLMLGYAQRAAATAQPDRRPQRARPAARRRSGRRWPARAGRWLRSCAKTSADGQSSGPPASSRVADIANVEHLVPRDWLSDDGFLPNDQIHRVRVAADSRRSDGPFENGLPKYVALEANRVEKKLPPRA